MICFLFTLYGFLVRSEDEALVSAIRETSPMADVMHIGTLLREYVFLLCVSCCFFGALIFLCHCHVIKTRYLFYVLVNGYIFYFYGINFCVVCL